MSKQRKIVSMTLQVEMIHYLDELAKENGLSRSAAMSMALNQYRNKIDTRESKETKGEE